MPYDDARRSVIHHVRCSHICSFRCPEETVALLLCVVCVRESRSGAFSTDSTAGGPLVLFLSPLPFFSLPVCVSFLLFTHFFQIDINDDTIEKARVRSIRLRIFDRCFVASLTIYRRFYFLLSSLPSCRPPTRRCGAHASLKGCTDTECQLFAFSRA